METGAIQSAKEVGKRGVGNPMQECIQICIDCYQICLSSIPYCLGKGGMHAEQPHISMLLNCSKICQVSADIMLTDSPLHVHTCGACAEICELCAEDCSRMQDDEQMRACADLCRRCAESCRSMSAQ